MRLVVPSRRQHYRRTWIQCSTRHRRISGDEALVAAAGLPRTSQGTSMSWSDGVLEYWSIGFRTHHSTTPSLHYSNYSSESFQVRLQVHRIPPRLDSQRFRDHAGGVVSRRAGNVSAGMARGAAQK